jgi:hypothetical protein
MGRSQRRAADSKYQDMRKSGAVEVVQRLPMCEDCEKALSLDDDRITRFPRKTKPGILAS